MITNHILDESTIGPRTPRSPLCAWCDRFLSRSTASSLCQSIVVPSEYGTDAASSGVPGVRSSPPRSRSSKDEEPDKDISSGPFDGCSRDEDALCHGMLRLGEPELLEAISNLLDHESFREAYAMMYSENVFKEALPSPEHRVMFVYSPDSCTRMA